MEAAFWPFGTERGAFIIIKIEIGIRRKKKQIHYGGTAAQAAIHFNQGSGSPYVHCGLFEVRLLQGRQRSLCPSPPI